jgi:hypothetical protein
LDVRAAGQDVGEVSSAAVAAIAQVVLEGVPLPASKRELVDYARRNGGEEAGIMGSLERLPARRYRSLDEVGEEIHPAQPAFAPSPPQAAGQDGDVPGGEAYLSAGGEPGSIREEPKILEYETDLVVEPGGAAPEKGASAPRP